eukprot:364335-Amphidinium_carterae.1
MEEAAVDPAKACFKFHMQNSGEPKHYYETIESALAGRVAHCLLHRKQCECPTIGASVFVAGFPCSPFSSQRGDRGKLRCAETNILAKTRLYIDGREHDWCVTARVVGLACSSCATLDAMPWWQEHKDAVVMTQVLDWIKKKQPESGLLENVEGLGFAASGEKSARDLVLEHLQSMGYAADWRVIDLSHHMACCRKRHNLLCVACLTLFLAISYVPSRS